MGSIVGIIVDGLLVGPDDGSMVGITLGVEVGAQDGNLVGLKEG